MIINDLMEFSGASKAGLDMLAQMMSLELGQYGIRTNCVNPTAVMTDMGRRFWDADKTKRHLQLTPLGRFAGLSLLLYYFYIYLEVDDVANAVLFLLSPLSSMTTGWKIPCDGGYLAI
jgi:L-xylulose reductase